MNDTPVSDAYAEQPLTSMHPPIDEIRKALQGWADLCKPLERDAARWRELCRVSKPGFIEQLTMKIDASLASPHVKFRFCFQVRGNHTHVKVFAGSGTPLAKCGDLTLRNEEWQHFMGDVARDVARADWGFVDEDN